MSDDKTKKTLTDADIVSERPDAEDKAVGRRSVLGVLGSLAAGGAATTVLAGCWPRVRYGAAAGGGYRSGITDSDGGPYADPAGNGRGSRRSGYTGVTDSDGGPYADPAGSGRGRVGYTTGVTDSDGGPYADPAGNGRGRSGGGYTGHTDSDGGPYADRAGYGRGRWR
jgi:hypothetical protein